MSVLLWCVLLLVVGYANTDKEPTLCSVLDQMEAYKDKTVRIRAVYRANEEASWIEDPSCTEPVSYQGVKWPRKIWLSSALDRKSKPLDMKRDHASIRAFAEAVVKARGKPVSAVFEGRVECCPMEVRLKSTGRTIWNGFGLVGLFPSQLSLISVSDIEIK